MDTKRGTVLIVDDNEDNIDLAEQILEDDYDTMTALSGQSCLTIVSGQNPPDVIVLDVQMPKMSGYETLEKLQALDCGKHIPVIFLSARFRDIDRVVKGLEMGAFDYITKPVDDDLLLAKVKVAMRVKQAEDMVHQQRAELIIANRDLKSFAYSASHDLRAPLRHLNSYSEALLEDYADLLDEDGRFMLERIAASSHTMGMLIEDLLNFSRASAAELHKTKLNLSEVAEVAWQQLQEHDTQRSIKVHISPDLQAMGDANMVLVILQNMFSNAWKYSKNTKDAFIEFGCDNSTLEKIYFVKDNGVGFDMAYIDKLFKPFCRLHSQEEFEGNGVGLATVHRIIEKHGGRIWAESEVGQGSTFFFTLS